MKYILKEKHLAENAKEFISLKRKYLVDKLKAFKEMGKVEANVFPSPVFISTMFPSCNENPAANCVSKCFKPIVL